MPKSTTLSDARVARMLSQIPNYRHWEGQAAPPPIATALQEADEQQLMTLAALALKRIFADFGDA